MGFVEQALNRALQAWNEFKRCLGSMLDHLVKKIDNWIISVVRRMRARLMKFERGFLVISGALQRFVTAVEANRTLAQHGYALATVSPARRDEIFYEAMLTAAAETEESIALTADDRARWGAQVAGGLQVIELTATA